MIRFAEKAQADLVEIASWLEARDHAMAERIRATVLAGIERLERFPSIGRVGRISETRELAVSGLPYVVVVYKSLADVTVVLRVLHGAMQWPQPSP